MNTETMPLTALLTPPGRGAVATIGYRGPYSLIDNSRVFRAVNKKLLVDQEIDQIVFGRWGPDPGEEVVLCGTSPDRLEIHCHGGRAASETILTTLVGFGCELCSRWEYLERTQSMFERYAAEALAAAPTPRTASIIAHQTDGPFRRAMDRLANVTNDVDEFRETIDYLLEWGDFARHLIEPWEVVLYGRPNVGKSSLMNALAGFERAIVLEAPGTTRDLVTCEIALDGWPIRLTDTAGLREQAETIETSGIERAKQHLARADLRILVLDGSASPTDEDIAMLKRSWGAIVVANKNDLADAWDDALPDASIAVSAKTGAGLTWLSEEIVGRLVPALPGDEEPIPVSPAIVEVLRSARYDERSRTQRREAFPFP